jgi:hypothetical protein
MEFTHGLLIIFAQGYFKFVQSLLVYHVHYEHILAPYHGMVIQGCLHLTPANHPDKIEIRKPISPRALEAYLRPRKAV